MKPWIRNSILIWASVVSLFMIRESVDHGGTNTKTIIKEVPTTTSTTTTTFSGIRCMVHGYEVRTDLAHIDICK